MKTRIIRIGNSRGIRIPKPLLEQTGLTEEVEVIVDGGDIILRSTRRPRAGWSAAFRRSSDEDKQLLDEEINSTSAWDSEEWEW